MYVLAGRALVTAIARIMARASLPDNGGMAPVHKNPCLQPRVSVESAAYNS